MTFLALKSTVKKSWAWCKHNWKFLVGLIIPFLVCLLARRKFNAKEISDRIKDDYEKEIQVIKSTHEKELQKREEIVFLYQETLKKLETEFSIKTKDLSIKKQKEIKKLVEENKEDPSNLAEEMKKLFGV